MTTLTNETLQLAIWRRVYSWYRQLGEEGVTQEELAFEADFAAELEPLLVDLYEAGLEDPESWPETGLVEYFTGILVASAAAAALLALLKTMLVEAFNVGGGLGLEELGLEGEFELSDPAVVAGIDDYAEGLLALLIATTANDLAAQVQNGREEGLSLAEILALLGVFIAARALFRAVLIAGNESVTMTRLALLMTYLRNGVAEVRWHTQLDEMVCIICQPLHGTVYKIEDAPLIPDSTHISCRCYYRPVLDGVVLPVIVWLGGPE